MIRKIFIAGIIFSYFLLGIWEMLEGHPKTSAISLLLGIVNILIFT